MLKIVVNKLAANAVAPFSAYKNTSAGFDITCIKDTVIPAGGSAKVPNGLRLAISEDEPYYMMVHLRSSLGFKKNLICHPGIIDAGYTGELGVKVFNLGQEDVIIKEGERYAQVTVHHKIPNEFVELDDNEWNSFEQQQMRGANGFGSSN